MPQGLSSADLRSRAHVPSMHRRNGGGNPEDPMAEASRVTKEIAANRMLLHAVNTETAEAAKAEAEAARAETEKLSAKIDLQRLQEQARQGQEPDQWQQYILEELKATRAGLEEARSALAQQQVQALVDRLGILEGELVRIKDKPAETPPDTMSLVQREYEKARGLVELFATPSSPDSLPPPDNSMIGAWQHRTDLEHARWEIQHKDEHEARMEQIRQNGETARADIAARQQQAEQTNRFFNSTAPKLVALMEQGLANLFASRGQAMPHAGGQAAPPPVPDGVVEAQCMTCQSPIRYRQEWPGVICGVCGEEHNITPDAEEAPVQQGESASGSIP